ncbi:hypothetical protein GCM10011335_28000 [Aureimonas glaciei]|uniref:Uncharacterized protein n=1 Tax=Aureimonas glaciei TaxID=1776957 RepID=A0A916XZ86_9HYPH|nr:hypothetical protein GCM10011335_28000 [Aureimonas glaciei]
MTPFPSPAAPGALVPLHPRNIAALATPDDRHSQRYAGTRTAIDRFGLGFKSLIGNGSRPMPSSAESVGKLNRKGCNAPGTVFDCLDGSPGPAAHPERSEGATGVNV